MMKQKPIFRTAKGQQLVEVACGLLLIVPIFLFLVDVCVMYMAGNLADGAARDAARAAAAVEPTVRQPGRAPLTLSLPNFQRADAVLKLALSRASAQGIMKQFDIDPAAEHSYLDIKAAPDSAKGGQWQGTVTIKTRLTYALPVAIPNITPATMVSEAEARFPITASHTGVVRTESR